MLRPLFQRFISNAARSTAGVRIATSVRPANAPSRTRHALRLSAAAAAIATTTFTLTTSSPAHSAHAEDTFTKEAATGLTFAHRFAASPAVGSPDQQLLATGCRYKYSVVKVYAVGLYIDIAAAKQILKVDFAHHNNFDSLATDPKFFSAICDVKVGTRIVLKMNRDVDAASMSQAFDDALRPRIKHRDESSLPIVEKFSELVRVGLGAKGACYGRELCVVLFPGGRVRLSFDGVPAGEVTDAALSWALMDTYVGANAVTPDIRPSLAHGFFEKVVR